METTAASLAATPSFLSAAALRRRRERPRAVAVARRSAGFATAMAASGEGPGIVGAGVGSMSSTTVGGNKVSTTGNSNYVVPLDLKAPSFGLIRPLAEILRDLNKRVPDNIINPETNSIPWYHVNRMLSFYAPGWCGEIRDVIYADNGRSVTVLYRVTIRGSDGEAHRESTGTVNLYDDKFEDPVAAAEEMAFCRACARFGFGLYLYHEEETML